MYYGKAVDQGKFERMSVESALGPTPYGIYSQSINQRAPKMPKQAAGIKSSCLHLCVECRGREYMMVDVENAVVR